MRLLSRALLASAFLALLAMNLPAQSIYGTFTGIVSDPSQSVVANAKIVLQDENSGYKRETKTNSEGYFTFASVPPGTYEISASASGFEAYRATNTRLGGGDKVNVNMVLKVGATTESVVVSGAVDQVSLVDSGEKSERLTTKELGDHVGVRIDGGGPSSRSRCPTSALKARRGPASSVPSPRVAAASSTVLPLPPSAMRH